MSDTRPACDLHLVVEIVHRAGIACELLEQDNAHQLIRARPRDGSGTAWTVHAGRWSAELHGPAAVFVGPADSTQVRVLRAPDERQIAALVVAQALHPGPTTVVSCAEVSALGLASALLCTYVCSGYNRSCTVPPRSAAMHRRTSRACCRGSATWRDEVGR